MVPQPFGYGNGDPVYHYTYIVIGPSSRSSISNITNSCPKQRGETGLKRRRTVQQGQGELSKKARHHVPAATSTSYLYTFHRTLGRPCIYFPLTVDLSIYMLFINSLHMPTPSKHSLAHSTWKFSFHSNPLHHLFHSTHSPFVTLQPYSQAFQFHACSQLFSAFSYPTPLHTTLLI